MFLRTFSLSIVLLLNVHNVDLNSTGKSQFPFTDEARAALCPFVGTEGMQCFNGEPVQRTGKQSDTNILKLPRGVGISIDRSTGRLKAPAVQLTYSPETGRTWTDGFTGEMFHVFNEVIHSPATKVAAAYNASRIQIFRNASQLNAAWQQTFVDGRIRGGSLAHPPDLYKFMTEFSKSGNAMVLSQSVTGLYTLAIDPITIGLNSFARDALSKLTHVFDPNLYDDFVEAWGTHIITKSFIGGMIEEQFKVLGCFGGDERSFFIQCLPWENKHSSNSTCTYYADRNQLISTRRLGGNLLASSYDNWKQSLSTAPAILQILEIAPWSDFVSDELIKRNLRTIIWHRQKVIDSNRDEVIRLIDTGLASCERVILNFRVDARWEQNGVTIAGGHGLGGNNNQLSWPLGAFVDSDEDHTITVADCTNYRIIQWKRGDTNKQVVAGGNGLGNRLDQLNCPRDVLIDKGTNSLIIADRDNRRVVRWSRRSGTTQGEILIDNIDCWGLAMDEQRNLYVSDYSDKHEVRRYNIDQGDKTGTLVAGGNGRGSGFNQLNNPRYVFVDRNHSVYISDWSNHRVMKWNNGATQGTVVAGGQGEGNSLMQLSYPNGIYVDKLGTLYVAEEGNDRVTRWFQRPQQNTVVLGGHRRGDGANRFHRPVGLAFDKNGNLYVVDHGNHRVQRFNLIK